MSVKEKGIEDRKQNENHVMINIGINEQNELKTNGKSFGEKVPISIIG